MAVQNYSYARDVESWYYYHADNLRKSYLEATGNLKAWETSTCYQIQQHANQQRAQLQAFYDEQVQSIKISFATFDRQRVDLEANIRFSGVIERLNELLRQCQTLKFAVSATYVEEKPSPFIYFSPDDQVRQKQKTQPIRSNSQEKMFTSSAVLNMDEKPKKNHSETSDSSFEMIDHLGEQSKSVRSSSIQNNYDECAVCHMIFPKHLSDEQRSLHLIQHG